ncbi:MAG: DUF6262 family protein [Candidatus Dormibacteria bacterium]
MTMPDHRDRVTSMVAAAKERHDTTRQRAVDALRHLDAAGETVNFVAVARAAGVSRAWLYRDPPLRAEIDRFRSAQRPRRPRPVPPRAERASEESLRALRASLQAELKALREENRRLRDALARKLGGQRADDRGGRQ